MLTCGIARDGDRLVARLVASDGRAHPPSWHQTVEDRVSLLDRLERIYWPDCDMVVSQAEVEDEALVRMAKERSMAVWLAPPPLLYALRLLVGFAPNDALSLATLLARMPRCPFLREFLERATPKASTEQHPHLEPAPRTAFRGTRGTHAGRRSRWVPPP